MLWWVEEEKLLFVNSLALLCILAMGQTFNMPKWTHEIDLFEPFALQSMYTCFMGLYDAGFQMNKLFFFYCRAQYRKEQCGGLSYSKPVTCEPELSHRVVGIANWSKSKSLKGGNLSFFNRASLTNSHLILLPTNSLIIQYHIILN